MKTISLIVGNLRLIIDSQETGLELELPVVHQKFNHRVAAGSSDIHDDIPTLDFKVHNEPFPGADKLQKHLCKVELWELWLDDQERYVFTQPHQFPSRRVVVDQAFSRGEIWGDFAVNDNTPLYPLLIIDIILFANWLATFNDLMLHAGGVVVDGQGYGFVGSSGKGKSTLVANLADKPGVTVLGEDQVVLRYLDGQFWIFGTPWHLDGRRCSPLGVPLKKLFFLDRNARETFMPVGSFEGIVKLMQTAFVPYYQPEKLGGIMARLSTLAEQVPFYTLAYKLGTDILPEIVAL